MTSGAFVRVLPKISPLDSKPGFERAFLRGCSWGGPTTACGRAGGGRAGAAQSCHGKAPTVKSSLDLPGGGTFTNPCLVDGWRFVRSVSYTRWEAAGLRRKTRKQAMGTTIPLICALCFVTAVAAAGGAASSVWAHSGATGVTKERMDLMKDMAEAMKIMGAMFKGEAPFAPAIVAERASFLADHAMTIPDVTPEGSGNHPSEALPIIWQEWDDYVQSSIGLAEAGAKLVEIANDGADFSRARAAYVSSARPAAAVMIASANPRNRALSASRPGAIVAD